MLTFQFKALFLSLLITLPIGLLSIAFCKKIRLLDIPGSAFHKIHTVPVPLAGGITLVIASVVLFIIFNQTITNSFLSILCPAVIIFLFGLMDDLMGLSAPIKLLGQFLAALLLMFMGVSVHIIEHLSFAATGGSWMAIAKFLDGFLTVFWVIGIVNAFNLVDSMDGLVSGISAWAFGFFVIAGIDSQQISLSLFASIFLGINLILSFFNASPAKLFLGDSGAQTVGFILAAMSILYTPIYLEQASSWFVPILIFAVPIFDTCLVFFSRLRRHIPFYKGNLDHTYHRLVNIGVDSHRAVFTMHLAALLFACLAMIAVSMAPLYANLLFALSLILGVFAYLVLEQSKFLPQNFPSSI
jgi:UDP-GlcNAc:undecaprenyl-phosphate GlcNAc-1-phosphate transferase